MMHNQSLEKNSSRSSKSILVKQASASSQADRKRGHLQRLPSFKSILGGFFLGSSHKGVDNSVSFYTNSTDMANVQTGCQLAKHYIFHFVLILVGFAIGWDSSSAHLLPLYCYTSFASYQIARILLSQNPDLHHATSIYIRFANHLIKLYTLYYIPYN